MDRIIQLVLGAVGGNVGGGSGVDLGQIDSGINISVTPLQSCLHSLLGDWRAK
jgi:hypothetical protein